MPVTPIPTSAPKRSIAPSASARATSSETAPCASISSGSTPASVDLGLRPSRRRPRRARSPRTRAGRSAARPAARPCRTRRRRPCGPGPRQQRGDLPVDGRPVVGEQRVGVALAHAAPRTRRRPAAPAGSKRVTTSTSPRRRQVVISSASRSMPRSSARRSVSAISDSGIPNSRSISLAVARCAPPSRGRNASVCGRRGPHRLQLARRPGQHDDGRARGAVGAAGPRGRARCRPARGSSRRLGSSPACGCPARSPSRSIPGQRLAMPSRIFAMRPRSGSSSTIARPWKSPTTVSRQVVGGRARARRS